VANQTAAGDNAYVEVAGAILVVTGASSGIGAALCRDAVAAGATVAMIARRAPFLDELAAALPAGRGVPFPCDVRDSAAVAATLGAVCDRFGDVDVLVNNAGIGRYLAFLDTPQEDVAAMLDTNLHGALHCTRAVLPGMLARRRGHIVNVASIAGRIGSRNHAVYCASKFALAGFSESLAYELEGTGVRVTLVNPGIIDTPFFSHASFAGFPAHARARAVSPQRVSRAILRAIRRGRSEVTVPRSYALGTVIKTVAPGIFRRLMHRFA
jgi:short-subunit dehydrogenase